MTKFLIYDHVELEQYENYQKGSYRNRTHIVGANGIERLSVPLRSGKHQQKPIREVEIAYDEPWQLVHWRAIRTAYGNSAYFDHYGPEVEAILNTRFRFLFDLNLEFLQFYCKAIGLTIPALSQEYQRIPLDRQDLRNSVTPSNTEEDINFRSLPYFQVFDDRHGFIGNLSTLDLLFAKGPDSKSHLRRSIVLTC